MRKIKHIAGEMARFSTPRQTTEASEQLQSILGWWRSSGSNFNPEMSSPDEFAKFNVLKNVLTDWKVGPRKLDDKAIRDIEDALTWWNRNSHRGFDESQFEGKDLAKFRAVKQALHVWRESAASSTKLDEIEAAGFVRQMEESLEQWGAMKDLTKFTPLQQVFVDKVRGIFAAFKEPEDVDGDFLVWMRNPLATEEILETVKEWKKLGGKIDMKDMPSIKTPREKKLMRSLLEAVVEWRRAGAYSDMALEEPNLVAKQILGSLSWWDRKGREFEPIKMRRDLEADAIQARIVQEIFGWLQDPEGMQGFDKLGITFDEIAAPEAMSELAALGEHMNWFRKSGHKIDQTQIDDEEMYEKASRLAQWWNQYGTPMDTKRAEAAAQAIRGLVKEFENLDDPTELAEFEHLMQMWQPDRENSKKDKKLAKQVDSAISWWRKKGYEIDPLQLADPAERPTLQTLKKMAEWMERRISEKSPDESLLNWLRKGSDPSSPGLHDNMEDIMKWFDVESGPETQLPKEPEAKLTKVNDHVAWWKRNDESPLIPSDPSGLEPLRHRYKQLGPLKTWWDTRGRILLCGMAIWRLIKQKTRT
jgi:hypothetical protein